VGLQTFENEAGSCEPHNSFVVKNYNGMEMAAKVGGYVAPTCGSLVLLWLLFECCKQDGCWGGKCIPSVLLLAATACQGITFLLFQSDLFCSNKDITKCALGDAGFRSIQACLVYAFCCILYYCGPTPIPFSPPVSKAKTSPESTLEMKSSSSKTKNKPGKADDWQRELYEQRRQEKKAKSQGASGLSEKELFDKRNNGRSSKKDGNRSNGRSGRKDDERNNRRSSREDDERKNGRSSSRKDDERKNGRSSRKDHENYLEDSVTVYDPNKYKKNNGRSQEKFDDYVDTEPDGMDWSAYTPDKREAYYEKKREKKKREKKADRHGERHSNSQSPRSPREDHSHGYDDGYSVISRPDGSRYEDDQRHGNSYYSDRDGYDNSGRGDYGDYGSPGSGRGDGDYGSPRSGRDRDYRSRDDYSYAQDDYSHAQDQYGDPPDNEDSYRQSPRSSSRHGRSKSRERRSHNDSYDDSYTSYDRRGYEDDPSFV